MENVLTRLLTIFRLRESDIEEEELFVNLGVLV